MHCNLLWIVEVLVAAQKGHFRVRHFAGVFIIPLLSTRFLYVFEHDGGQHVCLQMVSKFALSGSQKLEIFLPRRGGASGRRGLAPQGRRGQDFA